MGDTLTIIIVVVVVVALAQWRKKPKAELSEYTPERVMEMRIYLLIAWEYNALVLGLGDVIIRNRGGVVTVEEYRKGIKVAHYEGELKKMVPLILGRYGWEGWKLEARFF